MRLGFVTFVLLMATAIFACGGDELPAVSDPPTQPQQATEAPAQQEDEERPSSGQQTRPPEAGRSAESGTDARTDEVEKEPPPDDSSGDETAVQEPEREAGETSDAALEAEAEDAEPEPEEEPEDLTDVAAVVMKDADIRVRPGLSWSVIGRLSAGEEVAVLSAAGGWFRIGYGDDREGWIRTAALDLGEVDPWWILKEPAPGIVAEWQGEQYDVMGQSADGAEIRLLPMEDELAEMVSAPIDQVTLLADDITVHDLPILIGDETVVFPGDDFRVGQGKILPRADGWRWLSSGELLGYNEEHIWHWRPFTDELDLALRPAGHAKLSPDGRHLGIANCIASDRECSWFLDIILLPLDRSQPFSVREAIRRLRPERELAALFYQPNTAMWWSPDSTALLVRLAPTDDWGQWLDTLLIRTDGRAMLLPAFPASALEGKDCLQRLPGFADWQFRMDSTIVKTVTCRDEYGEFEQLDVLFGLAGEFLRLEPNTTKYESQGGIDKEAEMIRSAKDAETLGENLEILWSSSLRHAIVASKDSFSLWLYDAADHRLRPVSVAAHGLPPLEPGHPNEPASWAAQWHGDSAVAVHRIAGLGPDRGAVLVDVSSAIAVAFDLGDWYSPHCLPSGGWSPSGEFVQAILSGRGYDGLFPVNRSYSQIVIHRSNGSHAYAVRTTPRHIPRKYPSFWLPNAEWSNDGAWFVVGSIQPAGTCHFTGP